MTKKVDGPTETHRRLTAWCPSLVVLGSGLLPWVGAFTDQDAFAQRAHSAAIVLALGVSWWSWRATGAWLGYGVATAVKAIVFWALAPRGLATLVTSYQEVRDHFGFWEDYLVYFWAVPPAMLLITLVESWVISLLLSDRRLADTALWKRRRRVLPAVVVVVIAGGCWWLGRVDYYLWRMRAHDHGPSGYSLSQVGPRALPNIYREIHDLGRDDVGSYRGDLVDAIKDIRHDVIARRIGSPLVWEVEATLAEVEPPMLEALIVALTSEPTAEERRKTCIWAGELDFNTLIELFCATFDRLPSDTYGPMIAMISQPVTRATRGYDPGKRGPRWDSGYPWRSLTKAEIERDQAAMRDQLKCVPPLLVGALERTVDDWDESGPDPHWVTQAIERLGALGPLSPELGARLVALLPRTPNGFLVSMILEQLGAGIFGGDKGAMQEIVTKTYLALQHDGPRWAVRTWVETQGDTHGVQLVPFFCATFAGTSAEEKSALIYRIQDRTHARDHDRCVAAAMMAVYEEAVLALDEDASPMEAPRWLHTVESHLKAGREYDDRIASWVQGLLPRVRNRYRARRLDALAPKAEEP